MPKINRKEYEVLKELDDKWKWVARGKYAELHYFQNKPRKIGNRWASEFDNTIDWKESWINLNFIAWEDENPFNIAELIEEYESEETEVKKNKEWAFIELGKLFPSHAETHDCLDNITVMKCELLNKVYDILSQLDEPEVLSQEWIDEHSNGSSRSQYVWVDDLQNLLVPKQELPVIPKFVANYIQEGKDLGCDLGTAMTVQTEMLKGIRDYIKNNEDTFARAWLDGFTVEKEQKYYVLDSEDIPLLEKANNQTCKTTTGLSIYEDGRDNSRFALTEQEIKDYDPRYWPFRKPVEEMEE